MFTVLLHFHLFEFKGDFKASIESGNAHFYLSYCMLSYCAYVGDFPNLFSDGCNFTLSKLGQLIVIFHLPARYPMPRINPVGDY